MQKASFKRILSIASLSLCVCIYICIFIIIYIFYLIYIIFNYFSNMPNDDYMLFTYANKCGKYKHRKDKYQLQHGAYLQGGRKRNEKQPKWILTMPGALARMYLQLLYLKKIRQQYVDPCSIVVLCIGSVILLFILIYIFNYFTIYLKS